FAPLATVLRPPPLSPAPCRRLDTPAAPGLLRDSWGAKAPPPSSPAPCCCLNTPAGPSLCPTGPFRALRRRLPPPAAIFAIRRAVCTPPHLLWAPWGRFAPPAVVSRPLPPLRPTSSPLLSCLAPRAAVCTPIRRLHADPPSAHSMRRAAPPSNDATHALSPRSRPRFSPAVPSRRALSTSPVAVLHALPSCTPRRALLTLATAPPSACPASPSQRPIACSSGTIGPSCAPLCRLFPHRCLRFAPLPLSAPWGPLVPLTAPPLAPSLRPVCLSNGARRAYYARVSLFQACTPPFHAPVPMLPSPVPPPPSCGPGPPTRRRFRPTSRRMP
ncbi:hypothetical protein DENSPDRAFT_886374, partial [Dentipellis sp. KUC8613]